MARIRSIKPEAWQDEKLGRVSRDARLLFVVLITMCDDEGRFRALPSVVLGHGYPYDRTAPRKLAGWMSELADAGMVTAYEHGGVPYGVLPKWHSHQRVSHRTPSILPAPLPNGSGTIPESLRSHS